MMNFQTIKSLWGGWPFFHCNYQFDRKQAFIFSSKCHLILYGVEKLLPKKGNDYAIVPVPIVSKFVGTVNSQIYHEEVPIKALESARGGVQSQSSGEGSHR